MTWSLHRHRSAALVVVGALIAAVLGVASATPVNAAPGDADVVVATFASPAARSGPMRISTLLGNLGPAMATDVTVTVTVPAGATFVSATVSGGTCSEAAAVVTCELAQIVPLTLPFTTVDVNLVAPAVIGVATSTVTATAAEPDPNIENNSQDVSIQVGGADLGLSNVEVPGAAPRMTLHATVRNSGPEPATDPVMTVAVPVGLSLESYGAADATCTQAGSTITCEFGDLAVGTTSAVELRLTSNSPPTADFDVTFAVDGSSFDWVPGNNTVVEPIAVDTSVSIGDAHAYEGDTGGVRRIKFPVTLRGATDHEVSVDYQIVPGTASGGVSGDIDDKKGKEITLRIKPTGTGFTPVTKMITVNVLPDIADEGDESFTVVLSRPTRGAGISDAVGVGTVLDDDPGVGQRVGVGGATVHEGDDGKVKVSAVITLATPATGNERATVRTVAGSAVPGVDYKDVSSVLTFKPGQRLRIVSMLLFPNQVPQGDRIFSLELISVTGASVLGLGTGTITILDDD